MFEMDPDSNQPSLLSRAQPNKFLNIERDKNGTTVHVSQPVLIEDPDHNADLVKMEAEDEESFQAPEGIFALTRQVVKQENVEVQSESVKVEEDEDESPPPPLLFPKCAAKVESPPTPSGNQDVSTNVNELIDLVENRLRILCNNVEPKTPRLIIDDKKEVDSDLVQGFCMKSPIAVIAGLLKAGRLNIKSLTSRSLSQSNPNHRVELLKQYLQPREENLDLAGKKTWKLDSVHGTSTLKKYANYQGDAYSMSLLETSQSSPRPRRIVVRETIKFGVNIDLSDRILWKNQYKELEKLSPTVRPNSPKNMLSYLGYDIIGVNTVQLSMFVTGSRISGRQDTTNFCAVNLNIGPGNCEWFAVAKEYGQKISSMCTANGLKYLQDSWWPDLDELNKAGIPVYRFIQESGELVWINTGTIFWSQALGFSNHLTWRVGPIITEQFQHAVNKYDENQLQKIKNPVPMTRLAWELARNVIFSDHELFNSVKLKMALSMADCIDILKAAKEENIPVRQEKNDLTENCADCQAELFAVFFRFTRELERKKVRAYCLQCAKKERGGLKEFTGVKQYDISDLMALIEEFTFDFDE